MPRATVMDDLKTACRGGIPRQPLLLPIMDPLAVKLAGLSYTDYSTDARAIERIWSGAIQRFDLDWAAPLVDDLFEYEPLGIGVAKPAGLPFAVARYLPANSQTLAGLRLPDPRRDGRMPLFLDAVARLRDRWGQSILVCGSTAAPFSGLTLLYGIEQTMLLLYDAPDLLRESMRFLEGLAVAWGRAMLDAGADVLWLGDCSASSRFLSLPAYRELCLAPAARVAAPPRAAGAVVVYHAGENSIPHLQAMAEVGADILSVEAGPDMGAVKDAVGERPCLMGNLDSIHLLWHGTPAEIERAVRDLVARVVPRGGAIVNMGENTPEQTPPEHLQAMLDALRSAHPLRIAD